MSFQSNTINVKEAAKIFDINSRTVKRYIENGLINAKKKKYFGRDYFYYSLNRKDVNFLKNSFKDYDRIRNVKELFVLNEEIRQKYGSLDDIVEEFGHNKNRLRNAIRVYSFNRQNYFNQFPVNSKKYFLSEEVAERLILSHTQVIYELMDMKKLKYKKIKDNRQGKRYFIEKNSFFDYLGSDKGVIFYNSRNASSLLNLSVRKIDKIAKKYEIGRKIKEGFDNSHYLFAFSDICDIKKVVIKSNNNHRSH